MTSSAKTYYHIHTTPKFKFITPAYRYTQWLSIPSVSNVNVNWSAFLEGIVSTLQSHYSNNSTNGEHQLGIGNIKLLPLLTGHLCGLLCGIGYCLFSKGSLNGIFCHLPPHRPSHLTAHPTHLLQTISTLERVAKIPLN